MPYNILIVDDSRTTRQIVAKALRLGGIDVGEVHEAEHGEQALSLLQEAWVDLVIADLNMPVLGGVEMVERMAASELLSAVPVVIVSTEGRAEVIESLLARGVAAYVRKPFSPARLAETVSALVTREVAPVEPELLASAFHVAVEGYAMLMAQPLDEADASAAAPIVSAGVRFFGAGVDGVLTIAASDDACSVLVETATGAPAEEGGADALAELANVACGHLVDVLPGGPFTMDVPHVTLGGPELLDGVLRERTSRVFDVEGHPYVVGVSLSGRW